MIFVTVSTEYRRVTDGQRDGQQTEKGSDKYLATAEPL